MRQKIGNQREDEPAIDAQLSGLPKAMQAKAVLHRLKKAFNRTALAPQTHQINPGVRISGHDKTEFSFPISPFEPESGHGEGERDSKQVHLLSTLAATVEAGKRFSSFERAVTAHPDDRTPPLFSNCRKELNRPLA